jgi:glutaredoxin
VHQVVLYSREGCCLCDEAREVLAAVRESHPEAFSIQELDIDTDERLLRAYLERIPVITIDGVEAFEFFVNPGELERRLGIVRAG